MLYYVNDFYLVNLPRKNNNYIVFVKNEETMIYKNFTDNITNNDVISAINDVKVNQYDFALVYNKETGIVGTPIYNFAQTDEAIILKANLEYSEIYSYMNKDFFLFNGCVLGLTKGDFFKRDKKEKIFEIYNKIKQAQDAYNKMIKDISTIHHENIANLLIG